MNYDIVLCVSPAHKEIAVKTIKSLCTFTTARKIFVITANRNFEYLKSVLNESYPIVYFDEDTVIPEVDLKYVQNILLQRNIDKSKAGWYFQQFLKMYVSAITDIADHYLIWDSDSLLLQRIDFFSPNGIVYINPKSEYNKPYFEFILRTLNIPKQVNFSFISEHFMINKKYMRELIGIFITKSVADHTWVDYIFRNISDDDLGRSGFSEFETYGNFITYTFRDAYEIRLLKSTRYGTKYFGTNPNRFDLFYLTLQKYVFVSFETWQFISKKRLFAFKTLSLVLYFLFIFNRNYKTKRGDVKRIC